MKNYLLTVTWSQVLWSLLIIAFLAGLIIFFEEWKKRDERKRVAELKKEMDRLLMFDEFEEAISN